MYSTWNQLMLRRQHKLNSIKIKVKKVYIFTGEIDVKVLILAPLAYLT